MLLDARVRSSDHQGGSGRAMKTVNWRRAGSQSRLSDSVGEAILKHVILVCLKPLWEVAGHKQVVRDISGDLESRSSDDGVAPGNT